MRKTAHLAVLFGAALSLAAPVGATLVTPGLTSADYSFFPTPSAWEPGPDTARIGNFPNPGGATWSLMGSGLSDASGYDDHGAGVATTDLTQLPGLAGFVTQNDIAAVIDAALDIWAAPSGFTNLGQVTDGDADFGASDAAGGNVGDIRVGAIYIDGASGSNVLAHAYQPGTDEIFTNGNIGGDVHFDDANSWYISDINGSGPIGSGSIDFFTVALHELGHSLGLGHSDVTGSVMEATYAGVRTTLSADDIAGIQAIYGAAVVPVPAALWLFASGMAVFGVAGRRRARQRD